MIRLLWSIALLFVLIPTLAQTNRALFVGISQYPPNSGWRKIHGANDWNLVLPMLEQNRYDREKIKVLLNEEATREAIINALTHLANEAGPGDYVYVHFSCHGQCVRDDNGDEPDGLDEAIIPYDAEMFYLEKIYAGKNHIRDDDLGILLDKIRIKTGASGNLIVVLDACHSATGTRDEDDVYVRGTSLIFAADSKSVIGKKKTRLNLYLKVEKYLSPIIVLSACQPHEKNYEYKKKGQLPYGRLSSAICKVVRETADTYITNFQFSERVRVEVETTFNIPNKSQTPYYESTHGGNFFKLGR